MVDAAQVGRGEGSYPLLVSCILRLLPTLAEVVFSIGIQLTRKEVTTMNVGLLSSPSDVDPARLMGLSTWLAILGLGWWSALWGLCFLGLHVA